MICYSVCVLLISLLIYEQEFGAVLGEINQENLQGNEIVQIMRQYVDPLRILSAKLPNHVIEMQIEMMNPNPTVKLRLPVTQSMPSRRVIRVKPQTKLKGFNGTITRASSVKRSTTATVQKYVNRARTKSVAVIRKASLRHDENDTTTIHSSEMSTENPLTTSLETTLDTTTRETAESSKKLVYLDDLQKALNDLEKRLQEKQSNDNTPHKLPIHNMDDIQQLLKKAVIVKSHSPNDETLDWVQIKIPKNI